jgi:HAD superfamily hydrolase (TIGR01549 family)
MLAKKLDLIVFDLDNTIADETTWLFAAYRDIAVSVESQAGVPAAVLLDEIIQRFRCHGRQNLFQDFCSRYRLSTSLIEDWLEMMRSVKLENGFPLFEWVISFCRSLPDIQKAILTNGNPRQQKAKYKQLEPKSIREELKLFCAAEFEPKPSPKGLKELMRTMGAMPRSTLFLGDSVEDEQCAHSADVLFVHAGDFRYQPVSEALANLSMILDREFPRRADEPSN